jgi:hypothetical protein
VQYIEQTGFSVAGQAGRVVVSFMLRLGITMLKECDLGVGHDQTQPCCAPLQGPFSFLPQEKDSKVMLMTRSASSTQRNGQEWNMFCVAWQ